jgi:hypothetical protein
MPLYRKHLRRSRDAPNGDARQIPSPALAFFGPWGPGREPLHKGSACQRTTSNYGSAILEVNPLDDRVSSADAVGKPQGRSIDDP